ncbi:MAG: hypothetical protein QW639_05030 [Candidatus Bathyarchaeia archaeon]
MSEIEPGFIEDEAIKSLARMLKNITEEEGRFDLTDNIKRSRSLNEFTEAIYNALRVANTIKKQKKGSFVYIPNDRDLEKIFKYAEDIKTLPSLKNVIASYALSFHYGKEVE